MSACSFSGRVLVTIWLSGWLIVPSLPAAEVLIQTNFTEAGADGMPFAQPMDPPLSGPSEVRQGATVSSITVGTEPLEGLKPPYALFQERVKAGSKAVETLSLYWDLNGMGYSEGIYELTYRLMIVSEELESGARMMIVLAGEGGAPLKLDPPLHVSSLPAQVYLSRGDFLPAAKGLSVSAQTGNIRTVRIVLDLDKKEWRSFVDGMELMDTAAFPEALREAGHLQIAGVRFGSTTGSRAPASYALADVILKRLDPEP